MATTREKDLSTDVALIKQDMGYVKASLSDVKDSIAKLQFPSITEFAELKVRVDKLEAYNSSNLLGTILSNNVAKGVLALIGTGLVSLLTFALTRGAAK